MTAKEQNKALSQKSVRRSVDEEEAYWFIRWVKMRYERNKLQKENLQLKKTLEQIKEEYQPIKKKIHNGNPKRSKGYGRK